MNDFVKAETISPITISNDEMRVVIPAGTAFYVKFNPNNFYSWCKGLGGNGLKTNVICNNQFKIIPC